MSQIIVISAHVERIYDDEVWRRLLKVAKNFSKFGIKLTLFVYPPLHVRHRYHPSFLPNGELKFIDRILILKEIGHEIQLHSHFYSVNSKKDDFSISNIQRVLNDEVSYLRGININIIGFVAGGWALTANLINILPEFGIKYDCSRLLLNVNEFAPIQAVKCADLTILNNGLIELPTTDSIKSFYLSFIKSEHVIPNKYRCLYFHDYDLLSNNLFSCIQLLPFLKFFYNFTDIFSYLKMNLNEF